MDTQNIISRQQRSKKVKPQRKTLLQEYVHYWYIFLLMIPTCLGGYVAEIILFNFMSIKMPNFLAAFFAMLLGGLISTLPFFILNLVLFFKRKKRYAAVYQIVIMEIIGMVFFIYNQVVLTMA